MGRPRIGLLSIGEEANKGNELVREAHRLLRQAPVNFIGNVEGREIYSGVADVIVCDGFTGNIVLKTSEGLVETVESLLGDPTKARTKLGWTPRTSFRELVTEMVREDLKTAERDELIKSHGHAAMNYHE